MIGWLDGGITDSLYIIINGTLLFLKASSIYLTSRGLQLKSINCPY